jgi:hypothetical protein
VKRLTGIDILDVAASRALKASTVDEVEALVGGTFAVGAEPDTVDAVEMERSLAGVLPEPAALDDEDEAALEGGRPAAAAAAAASLALARVSIDEKMKGKKVTTGQVTVVGRWTVKEK